MAIVSITRLHLRSVRFLPVFFVYAIRTQRQVQTAPGFLGGWLGNDTLLGFWTATAWDSLEAMRAYRNAPPHLAAMKKLLTWCDEASYAHWEQDAAALPDASGAYARMKAEGTTSKVLWPSARQVARETVGAGAPRPNRQLAARKGAGR